MTATEYWVVRNERCWQSDRFAVGRQVDPRKAAHDHCAMCNNCFPYGPYYVVHITVRPAGQHAAWERIVRAAEKWVLDDAFDGQGQDRIFTINELEIVESVRALGPHRPEGV